MTKLVFLHLPDHAAGYPLSLVEAVDRLGVGSYARELHQFMSVDMRIKIDDGATGALWYHLADGSVGACVQNPDTGAWTRIPRGYWTRETRSPPATLEAILADIGAAPGYTKSLVGQPIVVWKDEIDAQAALAEQRMVKLRAQRSAELTEKPAPEIVEPPVPTNSAEKPYNYNTPHEVLKDWYRARVESAPPKGFKRDEDVAAGQSVGIGRDRVRDLRRELAPSSWSLRGKPRRRS